MEPSVWTRVWDRVWDRVLALVWDRLSESPGPWTPPGTMLLRPRVTPGPTGPSREHLVTAGPIHTLRVSRSKPHYSNQQNRFYFHSHRKGQMHTIHINGLISPQGAEVIHIRGGSRIFERGGGSRLGLQAKKGVQKGSNFGPNVKKPTSWAQRGGGRGPDPLPPRIRHCILTFVRRPTCVATRSDQARQL